MGKKKNKRSGLNLAREKYWQDFWEKEKIYKFNPKSKKPFYSVDTPPPYVSADHLHTGHIMSYSQAEFVVRYKRMKGYEVYYPMGFDDNGLPTERFVENKYKLDKKSISRPDFIKKCLEETKRGSQTYKNLWQLMGISVDWSRVYSTIDAHSRRIAQWSFLDLHKKGKMIRKDGPTYWCTACQTAIAQADLEDKEEEGLLNYIAFKSSDSKKELLIATTRPELLPACAALFVNPNDKRYGNLLNSEAAAPLFNHKIPILADEEVDPEFGTGIMMVCTWGDGEDVKKCKNHNLKIRTILKPDGKLNKLAGEFENLDLMEARKQIIKKLKQKGCLKKQEKITHNLNVHERCGTPVEFIKTKQWFIDVLSAKKQLIAQAEKMNWHPEHMKRRYCDWVEALKWDWCISRQRYYGVPFPVWYCKKCGHVILPDAKDLPIDPLSSKPKIKKCPKCGSNQFVPEKDVMDTWMTSSCSPLISTKLVKEKKAQAKLYPASLRPQAFEIIRTWLFYTVVKSFYHFNGGIPFKDIMISGHGLDSKGRKISKRLGNFTLPEKIIGQYGADALRYWATGATLGENLRYNEDEIKKGKRTVTKLFNAAQFCFSHFKDTDCSKLSLNDLQPEDKWILCKLNETIKKSDQYFESYQYSKAKDVIDTFFWNSFCDHYLEFIKHRLYRDKPDENAKAVLYRTMLNILKMYAPILSFITEEIYHSYFNKFEKEKSIHLSKWPDTTKLDYSEKERNEFNKVIEAIRAIRRHKTKKKISLGQEIDKFKLTSKVPGEYYEFIRLAGRVKKLL